MDTTTKPTLRDLTIRTTLDGYCEGYNPFRVPCTTFPDFIVDVATTGEQHRFCSWHLKGYLNRLED